MQRPEYDEDKNMGDDVHGCPGIMQHWLLLENYVDSLEKELIEVKSTVEKFWQLYNRDNCWIENGSEEVSESLEDIVTLLDIKDKRKMLRNERTE